MHFNGTLLNNCSGEYIEAGDCYGYPRYVKTDGSDRQLRPYGGFYYCTTNGNYDDPCSGAVFSRKVPIGNVTEGVWQDDIAVFCGTVNIILLWKKLPNYNLSMCEYNLFKTCGSNCKNLVHKAKRIIIILRSGW